MMTTKGVLLVLLLFVTLSILGCAGPREIGAINKKAGCGYNIGMAGYK